MPEQTELDPLSPNEATLAQLIECIGKALEEDDAEIRSYTHTRGESGGILLVPTERYCQAVAWKAVVQKWPALIEVDYHDLVIGGSRRDYGVAVEMKFWNNDSDLQEIKKDICKITRGKAKHGYIVVFSANPRLNESGNSKTSENLDWLAKRVFGPNHTPSPRDYRFLTANGAGREVEFWVAGWQVKP
jgi:hypothetical protein